MRELMSALSGGAYQFTFFTNTCQDLEKDFPSCTNLSRRKMFGNENTSTAEVLHFGTIKPA
jgi:hypothetical protein